MLLAGSGSSAWAQTPPQGSAASPSAAGSKAEAGAPRLGERRGQRIGNRASRRFAERTSGPAHSAPRGWSDLDPVERTALRERAYDSAH